MRALPVACLASSFAESAKVWGEVDNAAFGRQCLVLPVHDIEPKRDEYNFSEATQASATEKTKQLSNRVKRGVAYQSVSETG